VAVFGGGACAAPMKEPRAATHSAAHRHLTVIVISAFECDALAARPRVGVPLLSRSKALLGVA
jgi:hypothetical protein